MNNYIKRPELQDNYTNQKQSMRLLQLLVNTYGECLSLDNRLANEMGKLGRIATEIYGEELRADICAGSEIEFRRLGDDGSFNAKSTILIEDIIAKTK